MRQQRLVPIILLLITALTISGCMGGDDDDADPEETSEAVTAQAVLESARTAWAETNSAHFALDVEGDAFLDNAETIKLVSAEGDILRPDSVEATAELDVSVLVTDVSIIAVGGDMYMTNFVSGRWESAPDDFNYDPSVLFSETDGIGPILTELQSPELAGTEEVGGAEARRVNGTVTAETVEEITAGSIIGDSIAVSIWVGVDDARMLKVELVEPPEARENPATWTLLLSDHNKDVTIEVPPIGMSGT
jgi:hypothetical protein